MTKLTKSTAELLAKKIAKGETTIEVVSAQYENLKDGVFVSMKRTFSLIDMVNAELAEIDAYNNKKELVEKALKIVGREELIDLIAGGSQTNFNIDKAAHTVDAYEFYFSDTESVLTAVVESAEKVESVNAEMTDKEVIEKAIETLGTDKVFELLDGNMGAGNERVANQIIESKRFGQFKDYRDVLLNALLVEKNLIDRYGDIVAKTVDIKDTQDFLKTACGVDTKFIEEDSDFWHLDISGKFGYLKITFVSDRECGDYLRCEMFGNQVWKNYSLAYRFNAVTECNVFAISKNYAQRLREFVDQNIDLINDAEKWTIEITKNAIKDVEYNEDLDGFIFDFDSLGVVSVQIEKRQDCLGELPSHKVILYKDGTTLDERYVVNAMQIIKQHHVITNYLESANA